MLRSDENNAKSYKNLKDLNGTKNLITKRSPLLRWSLMIAASCFWTAVFQPELWLLWRSREAWKATNTKRFSCKICRFLKASWRWKGILPFSTTLTQCTHPNQQRNGLTKWWNHMIVNGLVRARNLRQAVHRKHTHHFTASECFCKKEWENITKARCW